MQTDKKRCVHVDLFRLKVILGQDKQHFERTVWFRRKIFGKHIKTNKRGVRKKLY